MPDWMHYRDDLEVQMRRFFRLPSQSLDYLSKQLGVGGKMDMCFQDWIDICEKNKNGRKALKKMKDYNKKDVEDTRILWDNLKQHFAPKMNMAAFMQQKVCTECGGGHIIKNGTRLSGKTVYQTYQCKDCGRVSRAPLSQVLQKEGKLG
jgi:hypothetical protein